LFAGKKWQVPILAKEWMVERIKVPSKFRGKWIGNLDGQEVSGLKVLNFGLSSRIYECGMLYFYI
jgi:hypothetical protein